MNVQNKTPSQIECAEIMRRLFLEEISEETERKDPLLYLANYHAYAMMKCAD